VVQIFLWGGRKKKAGGTVDFVINVNRRRAWEKGKIGTVKPLLHPREETSREDGGPSERKGGPSNAPLREPRRAWEEGGGRDTDLLEGRTLRKDQCCSLKGKKKLHLQREGIVGGKWRVKLFRRDQKKKKKKE